MKSSRNAKARRKRKLFAPPPVKILSPPMFWLPPEKKSPREKVTRYFYLFKLMSNPNERSLSDFSSKFAPLFARYFLKCYNFFLFDAYWDWKCVLDKSFHLIIPCPFRRKFVYFPLPCYPFPTKITVFFDLKR